MSVNEDFWNRVHLEIERSTAGKHNKRVGRVTSWDPKKHLAKVKFQPENHETGWLPVHTMAAGNGYGLMTGLTAGDGVTTGDQVEVVYQEGDFETGAIVARLHSEVNPAPEVQSGEHLFSTPLGQSIKMAQDKSITVTHPNGNYTKMDANGNITANVKAGTQHYIGGDPALGHVMLPIKLSDGSDSPFAQGRKS